MRVYVDTSALFAALVVNDRNHERTGPILRALLEGGHELIMTSYVLQEMLALLQSRVGLDAARRFEHELRPLLTVVWVDEQLHDLAFRRIELRASRRLSLADCSSFVAMEKLGIEWVFAIDRQFVNEGFHLLENVDQIEKQDKS